MSLFVSNCFQEQEEEVVEDNCCISQCCYPATLVGRRRGNDNATVTSTSSWCNDSSPCGCFGDVEQEQRHSSFEKSGLSLCAGGVRNDEDDAGEQHLGGQLEYQEHLLNILEEERAYHREELALAAAANASTTAATSSSSSSSWWRCGYKPSWSSISFACGGWLQFYEFGKNAYNDFKSSLSLSLSLHIPLHHCGTL